MELQVQTESEKNKPTMIGVARNFSWRGPKNRDALGAEIETPNAPRGKVWGGRVPSQTTTGSGGASNAHQAGSGAQPQQKMGFDA